MDPRNNLQNPFIRPLSQPSARDPRQAPIPPPPYTLQTPAHRLPPSLNNDPFLPRRSERDESRQEPPKPSSQGPYTIGSYAASLPREGLGTAMEIRDRSLDNNHGAPWISRVADGRADRYRHHATDGQSQLFTQTWCGFHSFIMFCCILNVHLIGRLGINVSLLIPSRLVRYDLSLLCYLRPCLFCFWDQPSELMICA